MGLLLLHLGLHMLLLRVLLLLLLLLLLGSGRCTRGSSLLLGSLRRLDYSLRYDHRSAVGSRFQLAQRHRLYGLRRYRRGSGGGGTAAGHGQSLL